MDHEEGHPPKRASLWGTAATHAPAGDTPFASVAPAPVDGGATGAAGALFDGLYDSSTGVCREEAPATVAVPRSAPSLLPGSAQPPYVPGKVSEPPPAEEMLTKLKKDHPVLAPIAESVVAPSLKSTGKAFMQERADKGAIADRGVDRVAQDKVAADRSSVRDGAEALANDEQDRRRPKETPEDHPGPFDWLFDFLKRENRRP